MIDKAGFFVIENQLIEFDALLMQTIKQLHLDISLRQRRDILLYLDKLLFWNKAYNLTAIKQPKEALIKHIFDCLAIIPHLKQGSLLDIGTGAGLPGVIIAICQPDRQVTVLDSNKKKIRFIKQVTSDLKIDNITSIASRIEHYNLDDDERFDVVTSRAFASLSDFVDSAEPKMRHEGHLQAMKGLIPDAEETKGLDEDWMITSIPLTVPMLNETRHLINLTRQSTN